MNWKRVRQTQRAIEFETRMKRRMPRQLRLPFPTGRYVGQS